MDEYKRPYLILWGGVTEALGALERSDSAAAQSLLIRAQQAAEEAYIEAPDTPPA